MSASGSSASTGPRGVLGRATIVKALTVLVFMWALAAFLHFPRDGAVSQPAVTQPQQGAAADHATSPASPAEGEKTPTHDDPAGKPSPPAQEGAGAAAAVVQKHSDRAAVIIENRPLENLIPVMLHFHSVLGPEWPIIFYTTPETTAELRTSAPFARAVDEGHITVRSLPAHASFATHRDVSLFLTDTWLWTDLAPYRHVFMFQADSVICSASAARADDFLAYDLIGAPVAARYGRGFNGGLSIRNRELVLDVVSRYSFDADSTAEDAPQHMKFEDQWLYTRMLELPARADGSPGANLPKQDVARKFAVETIWAENPFGYHQPVRWQKDRMDKIMKYCPEVGMIGGAAFF